MDVRALLEAQARRLEAACQAAPGNAMLEKELRLFVIDAYGLAGSLGLGGRINAIMQAAFFALASSWCGFVLTPQLQIGRLQQTNTIGGTTMTYPVARPGLARREDRRAHPAGDRLRIGRGRHGRPVRRVLLRGVAD